MHSLHVIGDADTVLAFALGGISGEVVATAADTAAAFDVVLDTVQAHGGPAHFPVLILITRAAAERIRPRLDRLVVDPRAPLVVEIPGAADGPDEAVPPLGVERG